MTKPINRDKLLKLADFIEKSDHFDLGHLNNCFSGHAARLYNWPEYGGATNQFANEFDTTWSTADKIIFDWPDYVDTTNKEKAVAFLRNFANTGRIKWSIMKEK